MVAVFESLEILAKACMAILAVVLFWLVISADARRFR